MKTNRIRLKEIFIAISLSSIRDKAIISLISSSGMKIRELSLLKVKDALISCNVDSIDSLLNINTSNTIPCWKITSKRGKQKILCSTPESLFYLVTYLKERRLDDNFDESDLLFVNSAGGSIESHDPAGIFRKHNNILQTDNPNLEDFTSENVRKFFADTCHDNLYIKTSIKEDLINMFMNGSSDSDLFNRIDQDNLINFYKEIIPFLTSKYYDSYYYDEYANDSLDIQKIVQNYYNKVKTDELYGDERLCDIACTLAKYKKLEFFIHEKYLDSLFKLSKIKLILLDSQYSKELSSKSIIPKKNSIYEKSHGVYQITKELGIIELIDNKDIYNDLGRYMSSDRYYRNHFITGKECCDIIENVCFIIIQREMKNNLFMDTH
jgi:hypothetical protein